MTIKNYFQGMVYLAVGFMIFNLVINSNLIISFNYESLKFLSVSLLLTSLFGAFYLFVINNAAKLNSGFFYVISPFLLLGFFLLNIFFGSYFEQYILEFKQNFMVFSLANIVAILFLSLCYSVVGK